MRGCPALVCATLLLSSQAVAGPTLQCRFSTECIETEPCLPTTYEISIETEEFDARLVTQAGTHAGQIGVTPDGTTFVIAFAPGAIHLLTPVNAGRAVRYTTHLTAAGMAITYHGVCSEA